jgi:hypothetical protein
LISNVATPVSSKDAANKSYVDTALGALSTATGGDFLKNGSVAMTGNLKLGGHYLSNDGDGEGLYVDTDGKVGIGTGSPGQLLDVTATNNAVVQLTGTTYAASDGNYKARIQGGDSSGNLIWQIGDTSTSANNLQVIANQTGASINFITEGSGEKMRISSEGYVGIGTSGPSKKLDIEDSANAEMRLRSQTATGNAFISMGVGATTTRERGGIGYFNGESLMRFVAASNLNVSTSYDSYTRMVIDGVGNVGIGTTIPTNTLHVAANATNRIIKLERTGSGAGSGYIGASGSYPFLVDIDNGDTTPDFVINPSGNVGIGSTNPSESLDVTGNIKVSGTLSNGNSWVSATLLNSWANYANGYATPGYKSFADGIVRLRGLVKSGTPPSNVMTLPSGMRPGYTHEFSVACFGTAPCKVIVRADGSVYIESGSTSWTSLDGIWFEVGQ